MKHISKVFLLLLSTVCNAIERPSGWETTYQGQYLKKNVSQFNGELPNEVTSDFNGDNITDAARLLINPQKNKVALFVWLSKNNKKEVIKLFETSIKNHIREGISRLPIGKHKTACGKDYWECDDGEPPVLTLTYSGIKLYTFESASFAFIWDGSKFKEFSLSD